MPGCTGSHTDGPGCSSAMGAHSPFDRTFAFARRPAAAPLFALLVFPAPVWASSAASDAAADAGTVALAGTGSTAIDGAMPPPAYGPPGETPGIPSDAELEAAGGVVGEILVDNQNIFNLEDPKD